MTFIAEIFTKPEAYDKWWQKDNFYKRILWGMCLDIGLAKQAIEEQINQTTKLQSKLNSSESSSSKTLLIFSSSKTQDIYAELSKPAFVQQQIFLIFFAYFQPKINEYLQRLDVEQSSKQLIQDNLKIIRAAICSDWTIAYNYLLLVAKNNSFKDLQGKDSEENVMAIIDQVRQQLQDNQVFDYSRPIEFWLTGDKKSPLLNPQNNPQRAAVFANEYATFTYSSLEEAINAVVDFCLKIYTDRLNMYGHNASAFTIEDAGIITLYLEDAHANIQTLNIEPLKQNIPHIVEKLNYFYNDNHENFAQMMGSARGTEAFKQLAEFQANFKVDTLANINSEATKKNKCYLQ